MAKNVGLAILREIVKRLQRGEPVTQDLLDRIPTDTQIGLSVTVSDKSRTQTRQGTFIIEKGTVTFHLEGEWPN